MNLQLLILCIDDEADVLESLMRDLASFEPVFRLAGASHAEEAREFIESLDPSRQRVALIFCDHVMPGERGVHFMKSLVEDSPSSALLACKVLFTGQASHEDTIDAINNAQIDHYQPKPWEPAKLKALGTELLTRFVLRADIDPLPYMKHLDQVAVASRLHHDARWHEA
ncbi:MAG: response regulator [Verrucomicrobiales bacterium]